MRSQGWLYLPLTAIVLALNVGMQQWWLAALWACAALIFCTDEICAAIRERTPTERP